PASDTASIQSRSNSRRMASHSRTNSAGALPRGRYGRADGTRDAPAAILLHLLAKAAQRTIGSSRRGSSVIPHGDWITPAWLSTSWGKKNILLDMKSAYGKQRFTELLADADVLLDGQRPGVLEHLGFDESVCEQINPNLVLTYEHYCSPGTPWGARRGFEQIAQAVTGVVHLHSEGLGLKEPTVTPAVMNDGITGCLVAISAVAALAAREEKGGFWNAGASLSRCSTL